MDLDSLFGFVNNFNASSGSNFYNETSPPAGSDDLLGGFDFGNRDTKKDEAKSDDLIPGIGAKNDDAETVDCRVKRWSAGKEGNLLALLSSLQDILWPECGWKPVSLTDLIAPAAARKVYRRSVTSTILRDHNQASTCLSKSLPCEPKTSYCLADESATNAKPTVAHQSTCTM
ncbi:OLC1v1002428C1 [Oldenlandia corymbosa var. corymbosa]|uniref:OLC1v1002428C1 n=1 Tax=Oldenlandia corymbosa var. corymbosa TaxID=529605 RepID=A0AAV1D7L6_OLDCO|nr:OLC1v1002428C1 [Oldenlandia corymbosa var. corymbosa]